MQQTKRSAACVALALILAVPGSALAQEQVSRSFGKTRLTLSTGLLNGESGEFVYDADASTTGVPGQKVSELQWRMDDVWMAGLAVRHAFNDRFAMTLDYWTNVHDGAGSMDDYDWYLVGSDWTHWSHHEDTAVRDVSLLEVNADVVLARFAPGATDLYALIGYRQDHFDWQARGGYAIYSSEDGYRDVPLTFADIPGISYEQTYRTPYLGLGLTARPRSTRTPVTLDARLRYSEWVEGNGLDTHHLRDLRFEDEGKDGRWLALDLSLRVALGQRLDLNVAYTTRQYDEIKATTRQTDLIDGSRIFYPGDAAGLEHRSELISLGLGYRF